VQALLLLLVLGADGEFFETRIRPQLAKSCNGCHTVKQLAGLAAAKVPEESRLYKALSYKHNIKMPPDGKLDDAAIADFRSWIAAGAPVPGTFWAFEPLKPGPRQLTGGKPLDRARLLRRVTYDLTGLPPTRAEYAAFLADSSPEAYRKVVERLLASPHYGERWARHWMDLVAYAETNGHEYDNDKLAPWRYRDYLIRAFNDDLPYNQFLREHIAGDQVPQPRLSKDGTFVESILPTAFFFFCEVLNSTTDPAKTRSDEVNQQIDVVGKAFNGLTIACARCHDHKFDPIPNREYKSLAKLLDATEYREVAIDSPARQEAIRKARGGGVLVPTASQVTYRTGDNVFASFNSFGDWRAEGAAFGDGPVDGAASSLAAGAPEFVGTLTSPAIDMSDQHWMHIRMSGTKTNDVRLTLVCAGYKARNVVPAETNPKWVSLNLVLERNRRCYFELVDHSRTGYLTVDEIAFSDHPEPPPTSGGVARQGPLNSIAVPETAFSVVAAHQPAQGGYLSVLGKQKADTRLELADRLTNILTARVIVNRVYKHHFGEGIVKSTDNFGVMGERPKDRALLDGLTEDFIAGGWSLKALHRQMVMSDLYQSDAVKPRRLEAEAVRDAILSVSGQLDPTLYGPSVVPYISPFQQGRGRPASGPLDGNRRRSLYTQIRRNFLPPLFIAFDYPAPASTVGNRGATAVPSQALMLLNNEFVHQQVKAAAQSLTSLPTLEARVDELYWRAFGRAASAEEQQRIARFAADQQNRPEVDVLADVVHVVLNHPEFVYVR
jgi:hypothetical protein